MEYLASQSPEADIDREVEELIGRKVHGSLDAAGAIRLSELQDRRLRLMRLWEVRRSGGVFLRRA
ncbi:MAG: hypothetical protein IIZ38_21500 [Sphingomonas sp.]|uniref:hypothetical protein n=1 Tax=Sphingomonas sp. TaxID=28214 RepID=UPI0025E3C743|nr:hypothetical protein [Sphingomonas sp.]MBQ1500895.1 hypothetical protein [Sphingomonas sp.]